MVGYKRTMDKRKKWIVYVCAQQEGFLKKRNTSQSTVGSQL